MKQKVSFFNWSIRKLLLSEPNVLKRAKIRILFTVLNFALLKGLVAVFFAWQNQQYFQLDRALIYSFLYLILIKLLLSNKSLLIGITHFMISLGLVLIFSNVLITAKSVNIVSIQFVFMLTLSSFYLLGSRFGIFYSLLSSIPIITYMLKGKELIPVVITGHSLASPGYEIIVILNFITIVLTHYLFHKSFDDNIKEKEDLNEKLLVAVEEANAAGQSKSDFLSTMSHELRTPLNSVIGMTDLFIADPKSVEKDENLNILKFSAINLQALINDILDFNKLEARKLYLEEVNTNVYALVSDISSGLQFQAKQKGVELMLDFNQDLKEEYLISDPTRISQIIYNLVGNAIKFTSNGKVSVVLEVLSKDEENIKLKFSVKDTGIGISLENQLSIFEPFKQASSSTTRDFGGTGLGLAIVKKLLRLFNSEIQLESELGIGSNFFFEISFKRGKKSLLPNVVLDEQVQDLSKLNILVVDDNALNRLLIKKVLSKWNSFPDFAENGQEAIDKAEIQAYDVILMDIHMPVVDGYEASKVIRCQYPNHSTLHIIAFTASVSGNLQDKIKDAGMDDFIYKPFNAQDLYNKLNALSIRLKG